MLSASFRVYIAISFAFIGMFRRAVVFVMVNLIVFIKVDAAKEFAIIVVFCC